jgi:hypothetical protein
MDSAWAVIVGAAIALLGSVVTPWIREAVEGKRRRAEIVREDERVRKHELGVAIHNFMEALVDEFAGREINSLDQVALSKRSLMTTLDLGLLLESPDMPIATVAASAAGMVAMGNDVSLTAVNSLTSVLSAWRRGQISAWEALDAYRADTGLTVHIPNEAEYRLEPQTPRTTASSDLPSAAGRRRP